MTTGANAVCCPCVEAALERHIDAEDNRRAEEILAKMRESLARRKAVENAADPTASSR